MIKKENIKVFLLLLILSLALACIGRYFRMEFVTDPLMEEYLPIIKEYLSDELYSAIVKDILIWATAMVILIDTIVNLALLYLAPYFLRIFAKPTSIVGTQSLYKFFKGDFR